jgi:fatty acid desaturase
VILSIRFSSGVGSALLNFYEHGLIDPTNPLNIYGNASTVQIQDEDDHGSLGGDFHIAHHLHPGRHWSLLIEEVKNSEDVYRERNVIVYRDTKSVVRDLLRKRFYDIAFHCVLNGVSPEEMAAEIQRRATSRQQKRQRALVHRVDGLLSELAARVLI